MLNRVIDNTIKPNAELVALISHVIEVVPQLVTNFQNKEAPSFNTSPLMSVADNLARGKQVTMEELDAAIAGCTWTSACNSRTCRRSRISTKIAVSDSVVTEGLTRLQ